MLILLTMTSGCVDAISFMKLGQVFTAAMTGNTVLFGLSLTQGQYFAALRYLVALLGFVMGAAVAATVVMRFRKVTGWNSTVTRTLWMELLALVIFAFLVNVLPASSLGAWNECLILILAFAMGVQGVAARRIGVNGVTTTVITSTLTGLVETVVWRAAERVQSGNNPSGDSKAKTHGQGAALFMWIAVIVVYGIGAGVCGALEQHFAFQAIWLPIGLVSLVIGTAIGFHSKNSISPT